MRLDNLNKILATLLTLSLLLLSSGCTVFPKNWFAKKEPPKPEIRTVIISKTEYPNIQIQPRPQPIELSNVEWFVVTPANLDQFLADWEKQNTQIVFIATSVPGYENLSINLQELRRYVLQQQQLLLYYEQAVDFTEEREAAEAAAQAAVQAAQNQ